jgi:hypothetical protein
MHPYGPIFQHRPSLHQKNIKVTPSPLAGEDWGEGAINYALGIAKSISFKSRFSSLPLGHNAKMALANLKIGKIRTLDAPSLTLSPKLRENNSP